LRLCQRMHPPSGGARESMETRACTTTSHGVHC